MKIRDHKYRLFLLPLIVLLSYGCASRKVRQEAKAASKETRSSSFTEAPQWVHGRPLDNEYYIGIASAPKTLGAECQEIATKKALLELVSEIKVVVDGNSLLYTLDRGERFKEEYLANIQLSAQEEIEGYEIVDHYQDDRNFWIYLRLSKREYKEVKERKKRTAARKGLDLYKRAVTSEQEGRLYQAFNYYIQAMEAIGNYLGESIEVSLEAETFYLGHQILDRTSALLESVTIEAPLNLNYKKGLDHDMPVSIQVNSSKGSLAGFALRAMFTFGEGKVNTTTVSSSDEAELFVESVRGKERTQRVSIQIDQDGMIKNKVMRDVFSVLPEVRTEVKINLIIPTVYLQASEDNLDLAAIIKRNGLSEDLQIVPTLSQADLKMNVKSSMVEGGKTNGLYVVWIDSFLSLTSTSSNDFIQLKALPNIKGVHTSPEMALRKAKENFSTEFGRIWTQTLKNELL